MRRTLTSVDAATERDDCAQLTASFHRSLRAERKSPATIRSYDKAGKKLDTFLHEQGMPVEVASIRREHVESFIESLDGQLAPARSGRTSRSTSRPRSRPIWRIPGHTCPSPKVPKNLDAGHRNRIAT